MDGSHKVKKSLILLAFIAGLCYPTSDIALRYEVCQILPFFLLILPLKKHFKFQDRD